MIFDYKSALKSKVGKKVDEEIWILELMKEYGLSYYQLMEETPADIYDLMRAKLLADRNQKKKK